jgi:hypothetical protein
VIKECGDECGDIIWNTDRGDAIKLLVDDICTARTGARTIVELVPKGSKGSNAIVDRAVQSVDQCLRTLKSFLDERMKVNTDVMHPVNAWLCE